MIHVDRPTIPGSWDVSGSVNFSPQRGLYVSTRYQDLAVRHPREIACLPSTQSRLDRAGLVASWCEGMVRMVPSATLSLTLSQVGHYPSKGCGQIDDLTADIICLRRLLEGIDAGASLGIGRDFRSRVLWFQWHQDGVELSTAALGYVSSATVLLSSRWLSLDWDLMKSHRFSIGSQYHMALHRPAFLSPRRCRADQCLTRLGKSQERSTRVKAAAEKCSPAPWRTSASRRKAKVILAKPMDFLSMKRRRDSALQGVRIPSCFHAPLLTGALPRHEKYLSHVETRVQRWVRRDRQRDPEEHPRDSERCLGEYPACWRELRWQGRPQGRGRNPWNKSQSKFLEKNQEIRQEGIQRQCFREGKIAEKKKGPTSPRLGPAPLKLWSLISAHRKTNDRLWRTCLRGRAGWQYLEATWNRWHWWRRWLPESQQRHTGSPTVCSSTSELLRATSNAGSSYTRTQLPHRAGLKSSSQTSPSYLWSTASISQPGDEGVWIREEPP